MLRARLNELYDVLDIEESDDREIESQKVSPEKSIENVDSIEIHIDKNLEIIHKMELTTDRFERFMLATPGLEDSFEKSTLSRPDSRYFDSRNEPLTKSFALRSEKSSDSLVRKLYIPYKVTDVLS